MKKTAIILFLILCSSTALIGCGTRQEKISETVEAIEGVEETIEEETEFNESDEFGNKTAVSVADGPSGFKITAEDFQEIMEENGFEVYDILDEAFDEDDEVTFMKEFAAINEDRVSFMFADYSYDGKISTDGEETAHTIVSDTKDSYIETSDEHIVYIDEDDCFEGAFQSGDECFYLYTSCIEDTAIVVLAPSGHEEGIGEILGELGY